MSNATKRPWKVYGPEAGMPVCRYGDKVICDQDKEEIAVVRYNGGDSETNAALICLAVNQHFALVVAIMEALQDWQDVGSVQPETIGRMQAALSGVKGA